MGTRRNDDAASFRARFELNCPRDPSGRVGGTFPNGPRRVRNRANRDGAARAGAGSRSERRSLCRHPFKRRVYHRASRYHTGPAPRFRDAFRRAGKRRGIRSGLALCGNAIRGLAHPVQTRRRESLRGSAKDRLGPDQRDLERPRHDLARLLEQRSVRKRRVVVRCLRARIGQDARDHSSDAA